MKNKKLLTVVALAAMVSVAIPNKIYSDSNTKSVFIDVGHGGYDNGTAHNGYLEDALNLQVANLVAQKLKNSNISVQLSRETDTYLSLSKRTEMANNSGADLFVSIHQNASLNKNATGIETYSTSDNISLAKTIQKNLIENTGAVDRDAKNASFYVLRNNTLPAVLVECGFISNSTEGYRLSTFDYQNKIANGIVNGIKEYFGMNSSSENTNVSGSSYKKVLNTVNVMSDRDKHSKVLGSLPAGTEVEVIDCQFDWLKIKYNGQFGYVSSVYVK